jgi:hypothetical protein
MAAPYNPPVKNEDFILYVGLRDAVDTARFKSNPTLASGDAKISKDGGAFANLGTLPTVTPASGKAVKIELTNTEMNADSVVILLSDQTDPPEWADFMISIPTTSA